MKKFFAAIAFLALLHTSPARAAGVPTVNLPADVLAALNQLETMMQWAQQLQAMQQQITQQVQQIQNQAKQIQQQADHYKAITGSRGFGALLSDPTSAYNYLGSEWSYGKNTFNSNAAFASSMTSREKDIEDKLKTTTSAVRNNWSIEDQKQYDAKVAALAKNQAGAEAAFKARDESLERIKKLQGEIDKAEDQQAIAALRARLEAEQLLLQNENTKVQALALAQKANEEKLLEEHRAAIYKQKRAPSTLGK